MMKKNWEIKKQNLEGRTPSTCEAGFSPLQTSSLPQHALKAGWEIKKLGDVCQIRPSKNETTKFLKDDDNVSFFPMEDLQIMNYYIEPKQLKKLKEVSGSYTCFANGDVLLAKVTPCFENGKFCNYRQRLAISRFYQFNHFLAICAIFDNYHFFPKIPKKNFCKNPLTIPNVNTIIRNGKILSRQ